MKKHILLFSLLLMNLLCISQVPILSSYPTATGVIYMDFDGEYVKGTGWNFSGPITAQESGLSTEGITEIFKRVAEDYRIFNINVTTDSSAYAAAPINRRSRIIVTKSHEWYWEPAGGTAYVGSFAWSSNTPAWVFSSLLGYNIKNIAEAVAHEAGHTLGLQHQSTYNGTCNLSSEYSSGQGAGEIGWAPIMGVGYARNMTTWHTGTTIAGCNVIQNDISVIAAASNGVGLREDDHGNDHNEATDIIMNPLDFKVSGLINTYNDRDVFRFVLDKSTNIRINAAPNNVGTDNEGANVDIKVGLLSQITDTLGRYNPSLLLNAGLDTNLNAGTYFLVVDGVSNQFMPDFGSVGSYELVGLIANVLPIHNLSLAARISNGKHELNWNFKADEAIKKIQVELSKDGKNFSTISDLGSAKKDFSWAPLDNGPAYYRVKVITVADERSYYSNVEQLKPVTGKILDLASTLVRKNISINSSGNYPYQLLDETGRLLRKGALNAGSNSIDVSGTKSGMMILRVQYASEFASFKLMKH